MKRKQQLRNEPRGRENTKSKRVLQESGTGVGHKLRLSKHTGVCHGSPVSPLRSLHACRSPGSTWTVAGMCHLRDKAAQFGFCFPPCRAELLKWDPFPYGSSLAAAARVRVAFSSPGTRCDSQTCCWHVACPQQRCESMFKLTALTGKN